MAYTRSISKRASLIARQRFPSFGYAIHNDERKNQSLDEGLPRPKISDFVQQRSFGSGLNRSGGFGARGLHFSHSPGNGSVLCRHMSTNVGPPGNAELINDVAAVMGQNVQEAASQAPAVSEVAIAAADSFYNVAALQHIIDAVHNFTGLNWWASIAVTTLLIQTATVPVLVHRMKASAKVEVFYPQIMELAKVLQTKGQFGIDEKKKMRAISKELKVSPYPVMWGYLIHPSIFITFFFVIRNMAEKVPSFKNGGVLWFTDLSTPDSLYIFPVVTALTYLITLEIKKGLSSGVKTNSRIFGFLLVPLTMGFPKGMFCYCMACELFSVIFTSATKPPAVRKFLGLPERIVPLHSTSSEHKRLPLSFFAMAFKKLAERRNQAATEPANPVESEIEKDTRRNSGNRG